MTRLLVTAGLVVVLAAPASGQMVMTEGQGQARAPIAVSVTPLGGFVRFGNHFETTAPLTFSNKENSYLVGGEVNIGIRPTVSVYLGANYGRSEWTFANYFGTNNRLFLKKVHTVLYEGGLQFHARQPTMMGLGTGAVPFVQLGVGAHGYYPVRDPLNVPGEEAFQTTGNTNFAYNVGVGADINAGRFGIRLLAKDYLSSLHWVDGRNPKITGKKLVSNFALQAGLNVFLFSF